MGDNSQKIVPSEPGRQIDSRILSEAVRSSAGQQEKKDKIIASALIELARRVERLENRPCKCRS